eukprot:COSAG01_NODE_70914_length_257_cov_0.955696_1_plen_62_part_01
MYVCTRFALPEYAVTVSVDVARLNASILLVRNKHDGAVMFSEVVIVNVMVLLTVATFVKLSQ